MAENSTGSPDSPSPDCDNVRRIHRLVRMMQQYDLTAIDLVEGSSRIRLRRGIIGTATPAPAPSPAPAPAPSAPASGAPTSPNAPTSSAPAQVEGLFIESPMVGTFYQASSPDAPPFVTVGSVVRPEMTVCVIEAMKVFTEIPAGVSGTIVEVLVQDKQPVEYGQPLFRVEPS